MGLQKQWLDVAEKIGVDNLLIVWRTLDSDFSCHADDGRLLIPLRKYKTYERFQRNRYIESLSAMGLNARQIQQRLAGELREKLSIRNISNIVSGM